MPSGAGHKTTKPNKKTAAGRIIGILNAVGIIFLALSLTIIVVTFAPVIFNEVNYDISRSLPVGQAPKEIVPIDTDLGILIPKIGANARIVPDVDPFDSRVYQLALTRGVAHAKGTVLPGQPGNSFIFSHSSANFYEATRYNSVFYLLSKLEVGDEIDVFVKQQKYTYAVTQKKIVDPKQVSYLSGKSQETTLTLMTCWPPGTTLKRLIVIAKIVK